MIASTPLASAIDKWRARWPEWNIGVAFLPAPLREPAFAWFALLQELTDAAWAGADATPGVAKLAWWSEELQGWTAGARRHPLGEALQSQPAPWTVLAAGLPALRASREPRSGTDPANSPLHRFALAIAQCELVLFDADPPSDADTSIAIKAQADEILSGLQAEQDLLHDDVDAIRALLDVWHAHLPGARPRRLHSAFLHERLRRAATGTPGPTPSWRSLWLSWRAARGLR